MVGIVRGRQLGSVQLKHLVCYLNRTLRRELRVGVAELHRLVRLALLPLPRAFLSLLIFIMLWAFCERDEFLGIFIILEGVLEEGVRVWTVVASTDQASAPVSFPKRLHGHLQLLNLRLRLHSLPLLRLLRLGRDQDHVLLFEGVLMDEDLLCVSLLDDLVVLREVVWVLVRPRVGVLLVHQG